MVRTLLAAALALGFNTAHAEIVTIRYDFPSVALSSFLWGYFGNDRGPTTGHILSTTLVINYEAEVGQDAADFYLTFDVPTYDGTEVFIGLTGTDLGWSGPGTFQHTFTSEIYNGEIRPGRFGAQIDGGGNLIDSYIEFIVDADPIDPIFEDGFDYSEER